MDLSRGNFPEFWAKKPPLDKGRHDGVEPTGDAHPYSRERIYAFRWALSAAAAPRLVAPGEGFGGFGGSKPPALRDLSKDSVGDDDHIVPLLLCQTEQVGGVAAENVLQLIPGEGKGGYLPYFLFLVGPGAVGAKEDALASKGTDQIYKILLPQ